MKIRRAILDEEARCYLCGGGGTGADEIDHVNGDVSDNDRANLRRCCRTCNDVKAGRRRK
jgi:5-methylcytosine-specific restriction endonuclease McrA